MQLATCNLSNPGLCGANARARLGTRLKLNYMWTPKKGSSNTATLKTCMIRWCFLKVNSTCLRMKHVMIYVYTQYTLCIAEGTSLAPSISATHYASQLRTRYAVFCWALLDALMFCTIAIDKFWREESWNRGYKLGDLKDEVPKPLSIEDHLDGPDLGVVQDGHRWSSVNWTKD